MNKQTFSREEVLQAAKKYFLNDSLAAEVWTDKYALKEYRGNEVVYYEKTPTDMHWRLAHEFARIEAKYPNPMSIDEIFTAIKNFKYIVPQGSPMFGIGNDFSQISISNCFVIGGYTDSYGGIMEADQDQVQLMRRRGGVGQDISYTRPAGSLANGSVLGPNAGTVLYMNRFSNSTREVQQDGRRGALMLSISIIHPDAEAFIDEKLKEGKVTGANVSVKILDDFMKCMEASGKYIQVFPIHISEEEAIPDFNLIDNAEYGKLNIGNIVDGVQTYWKVVDAASIWEKIVHNAWKSAEPGILFWDNITNECTASGYGSAWKPSSTNPCFAGDTIVAVADGRNGVSIKELADSNEVFAVYSAKWDNREKAEGWKAEIKKARAFQTGVRDTIKVHLSDGSFFICTPDHRLALSEGGYVKAKDSVGKDIEKFVSFFIPFGESKVTEITPHEVMPVYDLSVKDNHNFYIITKTDDPLYLNCSGVLVHNCGEIPLCPYDSCRLLSLNLYSYALNGFTEEATLDAALLANHTRKAMRLMDAIVDLEIEKIDGILASINKKRDTPESEFIETEIKLWTKIKEKAVNGRRTGLGTLGEGDLIAALGMKYGTPEATQFSEKLHQLIATEAYKETINMAKERGAFPIYNPLNEEGGFLRRMFHANDMMDKQTWEDYCRYGRRNIGLLTIAPTGTTSLMCQTTSGIEPLFYPFSFRKKKTDDDDFDFIDEVGDKWKEFVVVHNPFIDWFAINSDIDFTLAKYMLGKMTREKLVSLYNLSPYFEATAQDVDYVEKVRMQGAIQKWIDHSISVTVNMPSDATEAMVDAVYRQAWESGCKGITVYRDGCRGNILSTTSVKKGKAENFDYISALKRPQTLQCDVFLKTVRKEDFIIFVGIFQDKPYEIFAVPHNAKTHLPEGTKRGSISKISSGVYQFTSENGKVIHNLVEHMIESEQQETRNVSAMLRHRIDPKYIVNDVIERYATISSFHKAIGRVLRTYITDDIANDICPKCGGKLHFTEGCMKCTSCGDAKCG